MTSKIKVEAIDELEGMVHLDLLTVCKLGNMIGVKQGRKQDNHQDCPVETRACITDVDSLVIWLRTLSMIKKEKGQNVKRKHNRCRIMVM